MSDWQPIETAPNDTWVLLYDESGDVVCGHSQFGYWYAWFDWVDEGLKLNPTRWMPLPEPPK